VKLITTFEEIFGKNTDTLFKYFSPGRVNLIGEHTDYNGGMVLPAAISLGISAVYRNRKDKQINIYSSNYNAQFNLHLEQNIEKEIGKYAWVNYILGSINEIKNTGNDIKGFDILLDSNLPASSGLSSSAAIEVLILYIITRQNNININRTEIALKAQLVEHNFIGVQCGIMDQYAVARGKAEHALLLHCDNLNHSYIPLDFRNYKLIIINSNRPRNLNESVYNQRKSECDEAFNVLIKKSNIRNLTETRNIDIEKFIENPILKKRALHVYQENLRTKNSAVALQNKDIFTFGEYMNESHDSLRNLYEVSSNELDIIVNTARKHESCIGARLTGAGFGGCCIALINEKESEKVCNDIFNTYKKNTDFECTFHDFEAVNGVDLIK
jgi:galactokinase